MPFPEPIIGILMHLRPLFTAPTWSNDDITYWHTPAARLPHGHSGTVCFARRNRVTPSRFAFKESYDVISSYVASNVDRRNTMVVLSMRIGPMLNQFLHCGKA